MSQLDPERGYAAVYDLLHEHPRSFVAAQCAFLASILPASPCLVLDAGCGTGRQLLPLSAQGFALVGLDASRPMLVQLQVRVRRGKAAGPSSSGPADPAREGQSQSKAAQADLRDPLPFRQAFGAVICLESPLAYLSDRELLFAVAEFRRVLAPGGRLVIDVYDFPASLGTRRRQPAIARYAAPWGRLAVRETHRYLRDAKTWRMTQSFSLLREGKRKYFTVRHDLHIRTAAAYVRVLDAAGFEVEKRLDRYPDMPPELSGERRIILVARARG